MTAPTVTRVCGRVCGTVGCTQHCAKTTGHVPGFLGHICTRCSDLMANGYKP